MESTPDSGSPTVSKSLVDKLRTLLPELAAEYHVSSLALFGSYAREEQNDASDLDLLVEFSEPPSLLEFIRLERELSETLGIKVDLVMKTALKPAIGSRILQEIVQV